MVDKKSISEAIAKAKEAGGQRKFTQSVDIIVNLKDIDVSKPEGKLEEFIYLPHRPSKLASVCAFVGGELKPQAEKLCDTAIFDKDFDKWDARKCKTLAKTHNFFIAQADVMPEVAKRFGKFLAPRAKMPNPKAGQVVPPKANLQPLVEKLKQTVVLRIRKAPVLQCSIGNEKMSEAELAENAAAVLDAIERKLPQGKANIQEIMIKTTMGKPVRVS